MGSLHACPAACFSALARRSPAMVKYRKLLGELLLNSFMLQLFGLVSPLFFQVVMDKVLVHRGRRNCGHDAGINGHVRPQYPRLHKPRA